MKLDLRKIVILDSAEYEKLLYDRNFYETLAMRWKKDYFEVKRKLEEHDALWMQEMRKSN